MSVTISNCNEICNSPTNQSKAKMLYTFTKDHRFPKKLNVLCDKFYNIEKQTGRSTSLGYGNKYDFTKDVPKSPPPNVYEIKSEFQNSLAKGVGFGEGRQQMKITGPFVSTLKNKNPGPGSYESMCVLNKKAFSMKGKNFVEDKQKLQVPGPGKYETICELSPKGKYFLAKHRSSCTRNFNHFCYRGSTIHNKNPGPGNYQIRNFQTSPEGKYFVSKVHNSLARKFGNSLRQPLAQKSSTPGPGNYRLPSEFGHYLAKSAAVKHRSKLSQKQNKENEL